MFGFTFAGARLLFVFVSIWLQFEIVVFSRLSYNLLFLVIYRLYKIDFIIFDESVDFSTIKDRTLVLIHFK